MRAPGDAPRKGGFTLVELLVVIAIISLLVSILMPTLSRAKEITRETLCKVWIHNLTKASLLYGGDNRGVLPDMHIDPTQADPEPTRSPYLGYWLKAYWRDYLMNVYGIVRENFYSPCNPSWNQDEYFLNDWDAVKYGRGSNNHCIIGYIYLGNEPRLNAITLIEPIEVTRPLFAKTMYDDPYYRWIWSDLNRKLNGQWTSDLDSSRYGANHLNKALNWPKGSHFG